MDDCWRSWTGLKDCVPSQEALQLVHRVAAVSDDVAPVLQGNTLATKANTQL